MSIECCEEAAQAVRDRFLVERAEQVYLADLQQPGGNAVLYGPEITHCPFCGTKIGQEHGDTPTTF